MIVFLCLNFVSENFDSLLSSLNFMIHALSNLLTQCIFLSLYDVGFDSLSQSCHNAPHFVPASFHDLKQYPYNRQFHD